mmetsp:Transcript_30594/g.72128  ORF Transcript_30594/g.72128 Transcript_30594/m.72128 type:complete len:245 (+) Transcript_30594:221-955(+)
MKSAVISCAAHATLSSSATALSSACSESATPGALPGSRSASPAAPRTASRHAEPRGSSVSLPAPSSRPALSRTRRSRCDAPPPRLPIRREKKDSSMASGGTSMAAAFRPLLFSFRTHFSTSAAVRASRAMCTKRAGGKGWFSCEVSICGGMAMICETTARMPGTSCGSWSTNAPPLLAPIAARGSAASPCSFLNLPSAPATAGPSLSMFQQREPARSILLMATTAQPACSASLVIRTSSGSPMH